MNDLNCTETHIPEFFHKNSLDFAEIQKTITILIGICCGIITTIFSIIFLFYASYSVTGIFVFFSISSFLLTIKKTHTYSYIYVSIAVFCLIAAYVLLPLTDFAYTFILIPIIASLLTPPFWVIFLSIISLVAPLFLGSYVHSVTVLEHSIFISLFISIFCISFLGKIYLEKQFKLIQKHSQAHIASEIQKKLLDISTSIRTHMGNILGFFSVLKTDGYKDIIENSYIIENLEKETHNFLQSFSFKEKTTVEHVESPSIISCIQDTISNSISKKHFITFSVTAKNTIPDTIHDSFDDFKTVLQEIITVITKNRVLKSVLHIHVDVYFPLESKTSYTFLFEVLANNVKKLPHPAPPSIDILADSYSNIDMMLYATQEKRFAKIYLPKTLQILETHHGKIGIIQPDEKTTGFVFSFPFWKKNPSQSTNATLHRPDKKSEAPTDISKLTVLLVEDNLMNQNMVAMILKKRVKKIKTANNGKEALQILASEKFDVILMDIQMPILDGYKTTRKIREIEMGKTQGTPIIALTANALNNERERCFSEGMNGYLSKPFGVQELIDCITKTISAVQSQ